MALVSVYKSGNMRQRTQATDVIVVCDGRMSSIAKWLPLFQAAHEELESHWPQAGYLPIH
jgi:hypothetical protein